MARAVAFLLLWFLIQAVLVTVFGAPIRDLYAATGDQMLVNSFIQAFAALSATAIMLRSIDVRPWSEVGMARRGAKPRVIIEGWFLGGLAIAAACAVLFAVGWMRIVPNPPGSSLTAAANITLLLLVAGLGEEVLARGYLLTALRDGIGRWPSMVITSVLFGALHLGNAGVTAQSFLVVVLAGLFLAAVRVVLDSLYAAWAAHVAWNWVMAVPLHAPVSGTQFASPDFRAVTQGPAWITGGSWGPEGGLLAALGMLAALAYLYRTRRGREESSTSV